MFRAEKMKPGDFSFAVKLANTMDWNMAESDMEFMRILEPDGCFVLFQEQKPIGVATCITYGKMGWFGNLVVEEEWRKKGAGTFLVKHAVDYLRSRGVETVGLYAYSHLVGFYEKLGFESHGDFAFFSGKSSSCTRNADFQTPRPNDICRLVEFDNCCLGWNRKKLLEPILLDKNNFCYFSRENNEVVGFVATKVYARMAEIGPLLCRRDRCSVGVDLLNTILDKLRNLYSYICVPLEERAFFETLRGAGLREGFRLTRMFLGAVPAQNCVYLPESIERG